MEKFDFKDINLVPRFFPGSSRSLLSTKQKFGDRWFNLPIIPANMESVINEELAEKLAKKNYFYVLHRFKINNLEFIEKMKKENLFTSISIGVNESSYTELEEMIEKDLIPDYITIDIAHGHSEKMRRMLDFIKSNERFDKTFVISGNISTQAAVYDLENWGADAIKCGIAPGSACLTAPVSGFGSRGCQAYVVKLCSDVAKVPIISDGGIREPGDIAKALVLGASMVMIGGMLSGFNDSPGDIITTNEGLKKEFWGSASERQDNKTSRIEGKKMLIGYKDKSIFDELKYLEECLQSSISYGGGEDLNCFKEVSWI